MSRTYEAAPEFGYSGFTAKWSHSGATLEPDSNSPAGEKAQCAQKQFPLDCVSEPWASILLETPHSLEKSALLQDFDEGLKSIL